MSRRTKRKTTIIINEVDCEDEKVKKLGVDKFGRWIDPQAYFISSFQKGNKHKVIKCEVD